MYLQGSLRGTVYSDSIIGLLVYRTSLTPETPACSHILDTSSSVAVLITCLEALQKDYTLLQVGVRPIGAKLELDLLMHIVTGRKLSSIIEDDRGPAEALPELVQWCEDGILPMEKSLKNYPVNDFGEAREVMEKGVIIKGALVRWRVIVQKFLGQKMFLSE